MRRWLAGGIATLAALSGILANAPSASATVAGITLTSSAATVAPASTIDLTASMPVVSAGTTTQTLTQTIDPTKVKLTSASDITYPAGWTLSYSTDGTTFTSTAPTTANGWAALTAVRAAGSLESIGSSSGYQVASRTATGTAASTAPATLGVSTTGDGYQAFFDAGRTRVFNLFHHSADDAITAPLDCHVIATGQRCVGFPFNYGGDTDQAANGVVVGTTIWAAGMSGFYCIDISAVIANVANAVGGGSPAKCFSSGSSALVAGTSGKKLTWFAGGSQLGQSAETRLYALDDSAQPNALLYCIDTAARALCSTPTVSTGIPGTTYSGLPSNEPSVSHVLLVDTHLYIAVAQRGSTLTSTSLNTLNCLVVGTWSRCPGWSGNYASAVGLGSAGRFADIPSAAGTSRGVCFLVPSSSAAAGWPCWDGSGQRFTPSSINLPDLAFGGFRYYGNTVRLGTRLYVGNGEFSGSAPTGASPGNGGQILCYDASVNGGTGGRCNNATRNLGPSADNPEDLYQNYTVTPDPVIPNCLWITRHTRPVIRTLNILTGTLGCSSIAPTTASFSGSAIVPRMACATSAQPIREWQSFTLTSAGTGSFSGARLTVKDSSGSAIAGWTDLPIVLGTPLSLTSLATSSTGTTPSFDVSFSGISGSLTTATAQVRVVGDAPQLCTRLTAQAICPTTLGPVSAGMLLPDAFTVTGSGSSTAAGVPTVFTSGTAGATISAATLAQCTGTLRGTAVDTNSPALPVAGATVSLLDSSGNPVTYPASWPANPALQNQPVTAVTAVDGTYTFSGINPGNYTVSFQNSSTASVSTSTVTTGGSGTTSRDLGTCLQGTRSTLDDPAGAGLLQQVTSSEVISRDPSLNLVQNGDFTATTDQGSNASVYIGQYVGSVRHTMPGWTVTGGGTSTYAQRKASGSTAPNGASGQYVYFGNNEGVIVTDGATVVDRSNFNALWNANGTRTSPLTLDITAVRYGQDTDDPVKITQTLPTVVGQTYRLQFWQRSEPYASGADGIAALDIGSYSRVYFRVYRASSSWQYYTFDFVATATTTPFSLMSWGHWGGYLNADELAVDDIKAIRCAPTATSVASNTVSVQAGATSVVNAVYQVEARAVADTSSGATGAVQTISVLANDTASSGATKPTTGTPVKLCNPGETAPCTRTSAIVPGEGTYAVSAAGVVTFTPCSAVNTPSGASCTGAFTGTATPVQYTLTDSAGRTASSTITPSVVPVPVATNDTSTGAWNTSQTINPLTNDTRSGSAAPFDTSNPLLPSTMGLCVGSTTLASSCTTATTLTTADGTYVLNRTTGAVVFTPSASFAGVVTAPIKYSAADSTGQRVMASITPTVTPPPSPTAASETKLVQPGASITFTTVTGSGGLGTSGGPALNTTNTTAGTGLCPIGTTLPGQVANCTLTSLTVSGEGTYSLNRTTGVVTYTALGAASTGSKTPVTYVIRDSLTAGGRTNWASSTLTPVIPGPPVATDDTSTGAWDTNQVISVVGNDSASPGTSLTNSSVRLCSTATADSSCTGTSLTIANQGTYTVNTSTGAVTFDPLPTFSGSATPIKYVITQSDGLTDSATITPTVTPPTAPIAADETQVVFAGQTVEFTVLDRSGGLTTPGQPALVPASTCLIVPSSNPATCDSDGIVVIAGEGTYTLNPSTGVVSFAADPSATAGNKTPITYKVIDAFGNSDTGVLTPRIPAPPTSNPDSSRGEVNKVQTVAPTGNDSAGSASVPLVPTSVKICPVVSPQVACTSTSAVDIAGKGTFSVNPDGTVAFTPLTDIAGISTVAYTVSDSAGRTTTNTITVTVLPKPAPSAVTDLKSGNYGQNVVFTPLTEVGTSDSPGTQPADITGGPTGSRTSSGGEVTTIESVQSIAFGAMKLCAANETPPACTQTSVTTNDGTYVLSGTTVTFTPVAGFTGQATTPVQYQVANTFSRVTTTTTIVETTTNPTSSCLAPSCTVEQVLGASTPTWRTTTVTTSIVAGTPETASAYVIPTINAPSPISADPETDSGPWNTAVSENVTIGDTSGATIDVTSVRLCGPLDAAPNCTQTSVTIANQGTYSVDTSTGVVTFTPLASFSGTATPMTYSIKDGLNRKASSTYTPTIAAPAPPTASNEGKSLLAGASVSFTTIAESGALTAPGSAGSLSDGAACLLTPGTATCDADGVVATAEGVFELNPVTGVVTYTANSTAPSGAQTPVSYRVIDSLGLTATAVLTPTVYGRPTAQAKTVTDLVNTAQTYAALVGNTFHTGYDTTASSVRLCDPSVPDVAPNCSVTALTVAGEGVYSVNSSTGVITFTPDTGYTGTAQSITYSVTDGLGQKASNTITPIVEPLPTPVAVDDEQSGNVGDTLTFVPRTNDSAGNAAVASVTALSLTATSVRLCGISPAETPPNCTQTTIITVDGTYLVDPTTGNVTFTGAPLFTGRATNPVKYQISNAYTVNGTPGSGTSFAYLIPTIIAPQSSGGNAQRSSDPVSPSSIPEPTSPSAPVVEPPNTSSNSRRPAILPAPSKNGPKASPQTDVTIINPAKPVVLDPVLDARPSSGESIKPSSLRIWNGTAWTTSMTDPGVGTWTVTEGKVSFMPAPNFTGTAKVTFRISDTSGARAGNVLTVHVAPREVMESLRRIPGIRPSAIEAGQFTVRTAQNRCPDASVGGRAVATITVSGITVPIKAVSLSSTGVLEPPASNAVAAVSTDHAGLNAKQGTSVLTWHARYGEGCPGSLNSLLTLPAGSTFSIRNGTTMTEYEITRQETVAKGDHRASWFGQGGPHRLVLLTCNGLRDGKFTQTTAIFARPVQK